MAKYTKRADGRYEKKIYLGVDPETKKRKYKSFYAYTIKELEEQILDARVAMRKGVDISAADEPFSVWADRYYNIKQLHNSEVHKRHVRSRIKLINQYIGDIPLSKIKPFDIDNIIKKLANKNPTTKKPSSRKTLKEYLAICNSVFELALENDVIYKNPAKNVHLPSDSLVTKRKGLSEEEQLWIISTIHKARFPAMIALFAGLRRGELIALTWDDVNLKEKSITVRAKATENSEGALVVKAGAKTRAGNRTIPITDILYDELKKELKKSKSVYVVPNRKGGMHSSGTWDWLWRTYFRTLNYENGTFINKGDYTIANAPIVINKITLHMLRHTYATNLYYSGVDTLTASKFLGHSDVSTTLKIYTHLREQEAKKDTSKYDKYVRQLFVNS